jgi:plastocyanin
VKRLVPLLSLAAATAVLVAGCGSDDSAPSPAQPSKPASAKSSGAVEITDFKFVPATLDVAKGTSVTVTNDDTTTHTATADDGGFDTGDVNPGSSKTITLDKPGTYAYHCTIHPFMKGTIVVK